MTLADDVSNLQDTVNQLNLTMAGGAQPGGAAPVSLSTDDWNTITNTIVTLRGSTPFANSNDFATLVNAINAIKVKWDGATHVASAFPAQLTQLQTDAAAAPTVIAPFPPAPTVQPPGVVVVPGTNTTTVVPGAGFTGGQTAAVGLVGAAVGFGVGFLMWKNPRTRNPRRRRHRKVSEETA